MLISDGDRRVIASSLMWSAGCHFVAAEVAAKLGDVKLAGEKADFAKECKRLLHIFGGSGNLSLYDADGIIIGAALQWAAMEHEKAAKEAIGADRVKRAAFAGECARLADTFKKPN